MTQPNETRSNSIQEMSNIDAMGEEGFSTPVSPPIDGFSQINRWIKYDDVKWFINDDDRIWYGDAYTSKSFVETLRFGWFSVANDFRDLAAGQVVDLYMKVFAEAPYFEKFDAEKLQDYLMDLLTNKGIIITARDAVDRKLSAFAASQPLISKPEVADAVLPFVESIETSSYLAEDAVDPLSRRKGVSTKMKQLLIDANREMGFKQMVIRTSEESEAQIAAIGKSGGRQIDGLSQDVPSLRLDGSTTPDRRLLFIYDL